MEKKTFYKLLESAENLSDETLNQLKDLINRYPYFQEARVLYLQSLKLLGNGNFNSEVKAQSGLIADRQNLFKKLNPSKLAAAADAKPENSVIATQVEQSLSQNADDIIVLESNAANAVTINPAADLNTTDTDILELIDSDEDVPETKNDRHGNTNLIDKFLNSNPKIERATPPGKDEVIENKDISLSSIAQPEELASEPLAQIYLTQGYLEKALGVYEKLY
ncbi:MAG: hypothetical protein AB7S54_02745 [Bacteroidales bacterium]